MVERTLSIIKPDAVARGLIGEILRRFEAAGLRIAGVKLLHLSLEQARAFYAVHKERPFYSGLTECMSAGPILVSILEGEGAIMKNREIMGATDPAKAAPGTSKRNAVRRGKGAKILNQPALEIYPWDGAFFFKPS